jgi:TonB-linked SusC/RagA family outer membrane protein
MKYLRKFTLFFWGFTCFAALTNKIEAQEVKFSFADRQATLKQAIAQIEKQSNSVFLVTEEGSRRLDKTVVLPENAVNIHDLLTVMFRNTGLSYHISGQQVIVFIDKENPAEKPKRRVDTDEKSTAQQNLLVSGAVSDENGVPLPGVVVRMEGTQQGTITDSNGKFVIRVRDENSVLTFSFLGYLDQSITVGKTLLWNISMKESSTELEEVVVIAYGTSKKATITGALSTVNHEQLNRVPTTSITNTLAGILPGAATVQTTGQPGRDAAAIYVRGSGSLNNSLSSPLVLVDGVERSFSQIDPSEIESISLLKDASATAVFGVRGANGVILVTTRRGSTGRPSISVTSTMGLQQPISLIEAANSYDYARFWNIRQEMDGRTNVFTPEQTEAYRTGSDPMMYPNISWKDYMFNETFIQSKNNINISGGSENISYFVSLGYLYQNGLLKQFNSLPYDNNYRYNRYNYRSNIDAKLSKTTNMKLNIGGYVRDVQEPRTVEDVSWGWTVAQVWAQPFAGPGIVNGKRTHVPRTILPVDELRDGLFAFYGWGYFREYETTVNIDIDITQKLDVITKGLSVSLKGAYDNNFQIKKSREGEVETQEVYYRSTLIDPTLPQTDPYFDKTIIFKPYYYRDVPLNYYENSGRGRKWYVEGRVNYERTLGEHNVSALLLYNQSRNYYPSSYAYIPRGYIGYVGRVTYACRSTYLFDINVGYNGSENFAPGKTRYGLFPAFSAGWIATNEPFMQNQNIAGYLKLRMSWGKVGNDNNNASRFLYADGRWSPDALYSFGVDNPAGSEAATMGTPGNRNVTWETAEKQNYAIDLKFLKDRLSFSFDYFRESRTGILISPNMYPSIIATSLPSLNIGAVNNKGCELVLEWSDKINKELNYFVNGNMSYAKNKIINIDEVPKNYDYQTTTGGSTGRESDMYQFERLYQNSDFVQDANGQLMLNPSLPQPYITVYPGDAMYSDLNNDGIVDAEDRMVYGYSSRPEYVFGLNGGINYKGFGFVMNWAGATHVAKMLEEDYRAPFTTAGGRGLIQYFVDECWTPENQLDATLPRAARTTWQWNSAKSTLWLKDASYLRLKTVSLSYTLRDMKFLDTLGIQSMMLNLSGYNLLTFTKLKTLDPEGNTQNNGAYPIIKTYNLGITLNF